MKESKEYKIETISDIREVITEENIDNFLIDFRNYLKFQVELKKIMNAVSVDISNLPQGFIWIDDNKHTYSIQINGIN